ncbi:MAG: DUF4238 domain-containing protein [Chthoniobacter sp.]|uniref:DUF4238 domain-containing protein n=1 Tax=Chthoniobacter sp. TaxID=2510640 RepID=UPI0032A1CCEE
MDQKRQHFVSQHYLRQFRIGSTEQIAIATINPARVVGAGAIKRQCQENYFYGEDKVLEQILAQSENDIAPVLAGLMSKLDFREPELVALRLLAAELHVRTRKAVESAKVFPKRIAYEVIKSAIERGDLPPPPDGVWTEDMMDFGGVPGFLFQTGTIPCWLEMQTLNCKLLRAQSPAAFITSDDPVVLLNQFTVGAHPTRSFVGFGMAGFQLLLPVAPTLCLFFFDPKVYKVGVRGKRLVDVSPSDAEVINAAQIQTAEKCLYFHDLRLSSDVLRTINTYSHLRVPVRETLKEYPGRNAKETFLHLQRPAIKLPHEWQFCRHRRRIAARPGDKRNAAWSAMIAELMEDIRRNPEGGEIFERIGRILGADITGKRRSAAPGP